MSYDVIRAAIAGAIVAEWPNPGVKLEFENIDEIDHDNPDLGPFVTVEIDWRDADQASIENTPKTRQHGEIAAHVHVRRGAGTKVGLGYIADLATILRHRQISGVQLLTPRPAAAVRFKGWHVMPLFVSFHTTF